ncbi:Collectin-11 [Mactra antiquata]
MSFGYNLIDQKCRLYATGFYEPSDGINASGWKFYNFGDHQCPVGNGFEHARSLNICYHLSPAKKNITNARQYCTMMNNSKLVSLDAVEKVNNFSIHLNDVLAARGIIGVYIGLYKSAGNQNWIWDNGNVLTYDTQWVTGEPYCGPCTTIINVYIKQVDSWKWTAVVGNYEKMFVCEVDVA